MGQIMSKGKIRDHGSLDSTLENVRKPNGSFGECRNYRICRRVRVDLANGYCVRCWDRGFGDRPEDWDWPLDLAVRELTI
jgi:hypothetical protein